MTPIINSDLKTKICKFLKQDAKSNYEYIKTMTEIKNYRELVHQLPKSVKFPLFSVNIEAVKNELLDRVDKLQDFVFENLEDDIILKSEAINRKHHDIGRNYFISTFYS